MLKDLGLVAGKANLIYLRRRLPRRRPVDVGADPNYARIDRILAKQAGCRKHRSAGISSPNLVDRQGGEFFEGYPCVAAADRRSLVSSMCSPVRHL